MTRTDTTNGLTVNVLRSQHDTTNGGISARHNRLTVIGYYNADETTLTPLPARSQVFAATDDRPAVALRVRRMGNDNLVDIVPVKVKDGQYVPTTQHVMAGGNFASHTDSRLSDIVSGLLGHRFYGALTIHDRVEG